MKNKINTICDVLRQMRESLSWLSDKKIPLTDDFDYLEGWWNDIMFEIDKLEELVEEAQEMADKMEEGLENRRAIMEKRGIEKEYQLSKLK